jgi:hypothetical protein
LTNYSLSPSFARPFAPTIAAQTFSDFSTLPLRGKVAVKPPGPVPVIVVVSCQSVVAFSPR